MVLFIDIGNSKTKLALFDNDETKIETPLIFYSLECCQEAVGKAFTEIKSKYKIDDIFCSTVAIRYNDIIINCARSVFAIKPRCVTIDDIPIKTLTEDYRYGGFDRLLLAYGAYHMYKDSGYGAHVIISLGTATTTNIIDNTGTFLGGIIMPGVYTSFEGLCTRTGLPIYDMRADDITPSTMANTTEGCMKGGLFYQTIGTIKECFAATELELMKNYNIKNINFCITGGYSNIVHKYLDKKINFHPNLVLQGLFFSNKHLSGYK